jgi:hypothetical protein
MCGLIHSGCEDAKLLEATYERAVVLKLSDPVVSRLALVDGNLEGLQRWLEPALESVGLISVAQFQRHSLLATSI